MLLIKAAPLSNSVLYHIAYNLSTVFMQKSTQNSYFYTVSFFSSFFIEPNSASAIITVVIPERISA